MEEDQLAPPPSQEGAGDSVCEAVGRTRYQRNELAVRGETRRQHSKRGVSEGAGRSGAWAGDPD